MKILRRMTAYYYTNNDLKIVGSKSIKSEFDTNLCAKWEEAMQSGLFRYDLSGLKTRMLEGPHKYVALLNEKRATERRAPQPMQSLSQPFDPLKFNFNKVRPGEVLFGIRNSDEKSPTENRVIINVSPVDFAHSLIVPEIDENLNQPGRLLQHQLHRLDLDAPTGYGFEVTDIQQIPQVARSVFSCVDFMREKNVAYCLFICRGCSFTNDTKPVVRILLWPRMKVLGPKPSEDAFNTAALEMGGHLLIKDKAYYDGLTDESAYRCLRDASLPDQEFQELTEQLIRLNTLSADNTD